MRAWAAGTLNGFWCRGALSTLMQPTWILVLSCSRRTLCVPPSTRTGAAFDLRRDAAYNLSLIYKASGAGALARQLLRQHLTV